MRKWVYMFTEGNASMRELLGGKGANPVSYTHLYKGFVEDTVFQFFNCSCTAVTHTCTETAKELEYSVFNEAFVSNTAFNTFRNQFLGI